MSIQERRKEMLLLVEQWHESGQTQKDFARDHGITKSKMGYWVRLAQLFHVHPNLITKWKKDFLSNAGKVFGSYHGSVQPVYCWLEPFQYNGSRMGCVSVKRSC